MNTFEEIMKSLFNQKTAWYVDMFGKIKSTKTTLFADRNNCTSQEQIEKWLCINDLLNIAHFYNQQWTPNWSNTNEKKFTIAVENFTTPAFSVIETNSQISGFVTFKTVEGAQEAIRILGIEKLAKIFLT